VEILSRTYRRQLHLPIDISLADTIVGSTSYVKFLLKPPAEIDVGKLFTNFISNWLSNIDYRPTVAAVRSKM
jgi:hypothetical protein